MCAVTNGVTHSPTWGIWGLVMLYLQLQGEKSDITEVIKKNNTAKSYSPPLHVPGWWEKCGPEVIAKGSWGSGLGVQGGISLTRFC